MDPERTGQAISAPLIHFCFPQPLPAIPSPHPAPWRGQEPGEARECTQSPERGDFQKQRTLSSGVYTSLYKRIKSSINMQLYTESNPSLGWPEGWGGSEVPEGKGVSPLGPDEGGGGKGCQGPSPGAQPGGLALAASGSIGQGTQSRLGGRLVTVAMVRGLQPGPLLSPPPLPSSLAKCTLGPEGGGRGPAQPSPGGMLSAVPWSVAPLGASLCSDLRGSEGGVEQQSGPDPVELGQRQLPVLGRDPRRGLRLDLGQGLQGQLSAPPGGSFWLPTWAAGSTLQL